MKTKRFTLIILVLLFISIALSACAGGNRVVASGWAGITTDDEIAYLAYNTHVYAIDLANGNLRWKYPTEPDPKITFYAPPALTEDGQLIIGGYDNILYSLNPLNGQVNWTFEGSGGRYVGGPLVTEYGIFVPSTDYKVYTLDFNGRPLRDAIPTEAEIWATPGSDPECKCVYVASMDHQVYAINAQTGSLTWITNDLGGALVGTPALSADRQLYIGTFAEEMVALNADNGAELWRFTAQDWVWGGPALSDETLYFGDLSGAFFALDRQSGVQKWQTQAGSAIVDTPLVTEEAIYLTAESGLLVSVTPEGVNRWQKEFEGNTYTGPVAAGDLILVSTSQPEALLVAFDSAGVQKWSFSDASE